MATELLGHFDAKAIAKVAENIESMKTARRDYIWPAKRIRMEGGKITLSGKTFCVAGAEGAKLHFTEWRDAEAAADSSGGKLDVMEDGGTYDLNRTASTQIAEKLEIPAKYLQSLRARGRDDLADHNVTALLAKDERRFLLRTLVGNDGNRIRAFLSDGYRILDNADLFYCAAETFQAVQADVWKARLWGEGDGFELFAVAPQIRGQVRLDRPFDPGDRWMSRWKGSEGDVQNAAVRISNSETGGGGLTVKMCVMTRVCANFCVWGNGISKIHLGRRKEEGLVLSADTEAMESELVWKKVRDAIRTAFDPTKFHAYIEKLNRLTQQIVPEPEVAVSNVVQAYGVTEERRSAILSNLLASRDRTRYGLLQAVTETAHYADQEGKAEEASRLEELGGKLVEISDSEFATLIR